jgi:hypothetical protein
MLRDYISETFAKNVGLSTAEIFDDDLTLMEVIERSNKLHNSIDLMESFAKTANSLKKEYDIQVNLPPLPLDIKMSKVLDFFMDEADK